MKILADWSRSPPKATHVTRLRKLAAEAGESPVAQRASHVADVAELASGGS